MTVCIMPVCNSVVYIAMASVVAAMRLGNKCEVFTSEKTLVESFVICLFHLNWPFL